MEKLNGKKRLIDFFYWIIWRKKSIQNFKYRKEKKYLKGENILFVEKSHFFDKKRLIIYLSMKKIKKVFKIIKFNH